MDILLEIFKYRPFSELFIFEVTLGLLFTVFFSSLIQPLCGEYNVQFVLTPGILTCAFKMSLKSAAGVE